MAAMRPGRALLLLGILFAGSLLVLPVMTRMAGERLRSEARQRGLDASWRRLRWRWPAGVRFERLVLGSASDTLLDARSLDLSASFWSVASLRPRLRGIRLAGATVRLPRSRGADSDTVPANGTVRNQDPRRAERVRRSAEELVRLLLTPARRLPELSLRDVTLLVPSGAEELWEGVRISWMTLGHGGGRAKLDISGELLGERPLPFEGALRYALDDRINGGLLVSVPNQGGPASQVRIGVDGRVTQDRDHGRLVVHQSTRLTVGRIPFLVDGVLERQGPRFQIRLRSDGLTEERFKESLPPSVLGELSQVAVRGSWDYRLELDLDFAHPDSVEFQASVRPHDLALVPGRTRLRLLGLHQPFTALVRLPRGRVVARELVPGHPDFHPLETISPYLVYAVVTNEDGAFFRHRGFNTEAVREAIAENLKAGAFRRGAGTITMQLARNLYLGHERSLSRKFREVVLAWVLEHLAGVSKERLLEIYLNVIEWGPGIHGIGQAARYYFDSHPGDLTVSESLFLATIIPAPSRWRSRFNGFGELRPYARAQMHFIGRAAVAKGWLDPYALPDPEWLHVELRGPARERFLPRPPEPPDTLEAALPGQILLARREVRG